jgi:inorganic pyrophosphatase
VVKGFRDVDWAIKEYNECVSLMDQYSSLDKEDFINKMMKEHPEKYKI